MALTKSDLEWARLAGEYHARAMRAERRVTELEAEIAKWKEFTGLDEPSWDATLPDLTFATLPIILQGVGKSTADVTFEWKQAKSASDGD